MIELIIFDCDGTLVDSEFTNNKAFSDYVIEQGLPKYTVDYCLTHFVGTSLPDNVKVIERENNITFPSDYMERYIDRVQELSPEHTEIIPGAMDAVGVLVQRYKACVASNGERLNVVSSLHACGYGDVFADSHIYTKSQVANPKPAPDLFLYAAQEMGVLPERTVVIEDSVSGVRAGHAAGMHVIAFMPHGDAEQGQRLIEAGAQVIMRDWGECGDILQAIDGTENSTDSVKENLAFGTR